MNVPAESFDVVMIALTLGEIPKREAALKRAFNALRAGGVLSVTELFPDPHFNRRSTVKRLAEDAGLEHRATHGNALYFNAHFVKLREGTDDQARTSPRPPSEAPKQVPQLRLDQLPHSAAQEAGVRLPEPRPLPRRDLLPPQGARPQTMACSSPHFPETP